MRKITLCAFVLLTAVAVQAQITTSFETADGFAEAALNGQNGWTSSAGFDANVLVTDEESSDGDLSLQFLGSNSGDQIVGFSPLEPITADAIVLTADMFLETGSGTPSQIDIVTQSPSQSLLTTRVRFNSDDTIFILDDDPASPGTLAFLDTGETFDRDEWFELRIEHNFADGEIIYLIDDDVIFTGTVIAATNVEQFVPVFINQGSNAYIDNVQYEEFLSVDDEVLAGQISVYPNPTSANLNIDFATNLGDTEVNITNVNGQSVMRSSINGIGSNVLNTSNLSSGIYFAQISTANAATTIKFIKQ